MKSLDLCVPTHNEAQVIAETLTTILDVSQKHPNVTTRIIISDNGSSDATAIIVQSLKLKNVTVVSDPQPGKGLAVGRVAQNSNADYFAYIDADLSVDPEQVYRFLKVVESGADVVTASRLKDQSIVDRSLLRTLSPRLYNGFVHLVLGLKTQDAQCGLKVMNRRGLEVLQRCQEATWFQDTEFIWLAERAGLRVEEVAVQWVEFRYPDRKSKFSAVRGALKMLPALCRILWRHR